MKTKTYRIIENIIVYGNRKEYEYKIQNKNVFGFWVNTKIPLIDYKRKFSDFYIPVVIYQTHIFSSKEIVLKVIEILKEEITIYKGEKIIPCFSTSVREKLYLYSEYIFNYLENAKREIDKKEKNKVLKYEKNIIY